MSDIERRMAEWRKNLWGTGPWPDSSQENFHLTAAEREAVRFCTTAALPETQKLGGAAGELCRLHAATLRGLLERLARLSPPAT